MCVQTRCFHSTLHKMKWQVLAAGTGLGVEVHGQRKPPRVPPLGGWWVRVMLLGAAGRWIWARNCVEHRVGEEHVPGCKHVCERDPGCLNNVKY